MRFWLTLLLLTCIAIIFFLGPCAYEVEDGSLDDDSQILAVQK